VRRLRIVCVLVVTVFAALALNIALENPGSSAAAQTQSQARSAAATPATTLVPAAAASAPAASNKIPPTILASNIGVRTLAAARPTSETIAGLPSSTASASTEQLLLTSADTPNKVFSFLLPASSKSAMTAAASPAKFMTTVAGIGEVGSVGDGGIATSAQLDLNFSDITMRSGVAVTPDGTIYIADSGNATIRMVAGPASSEPGIIRSVAGRWAPRQNVELNEPMGIALDRAGNLFIADSGANAIDILYGPSSPKSGQLETIAHMVAPGSVAITLDGGTVFASSPQTGIILAVNTQTHAIRTLAMNPAALFGSAQQRSSIGSPRITPTGLAVDGGGNLFVAYSDPTASYDEILRLDAFSAKVTLAARGLSSPGDISFDAKGNLFVANQGMRDVVRFNLLGVPATGVTLTAPVPKCTDSATLFCDQLIGGTSPTQSFELTNNTPTEISGITPGFLTGNTGDFAVSSSSCGATLAASSNCAFNIAFTPTANASAFQSNDGTTCSASATANSRCSAFTVNYTGAIIPLATAVTGIADDFQIVCVTSTTTSCVDVPPDSVFDKTTILQGGFATFQLQIVPDSTFSGPVTLVCPSNLPVSPIGSLGSPTTCGLSLGTSVSEPLQTTLVVNVVPRTPLPFNMTIQTTTTLGTQTPPSATPPPAAKRSFSLLGLLASRSNGSGGTGASPAAPKTIVAKRPMPAFVTNRFFALLIACSLFIFTVTKQKTFLRRHPAAAIFVLALIIATVVGCGGNSNSKGTIPFTPTGTFNLTVQGSAQNGARGYTCTLIVASN
jgi:sugar lactone lactonase YvrE